MPHIHLSLQAGDDMVLTRMKRRHRRADAVAVVDRLKSARPAIAIGADLIAGFPTEDENMFANSLALIDDADKIGRAHVWTPVTNAHLVCRLLLDKKKPNQEDNDRDRQDRKHRH